MKQIIDEYIKNNSESFHRYNSWSHCFQAFRELTDKNLQSLHLGFYLASWGMYRGSSMLLQRDYLVHVEAISILKSYNHLSCDRDINNSQLKDILKLIKELSIYYKIKHNVTPTDTLISKIILGTLGCLPAFDRYFIEGIKIKKQAFNSLKPKSLNNLFNFIEDNEELKALQKEHPQYPMMKLVDMYFWQIGYNKSLIKIEALNEY